MFWRPGRLTNNSFVHAGDGTARESETATPALHRKYQQANVAESQWFQVAGLAATAGSWWPVTRLRHHH
jgi:hypothetical protein